MTHFTVIIMMMNIITMTAAVSVTPLLSPVFSVLLLLLQVFKRPWPGIMRTVFGNHERFENTYFKKFPGFYVTGDGKSQHASGKISFCQHTDVTQSP